MRAWLPIFDRSSLMDRKAGEPRLATVYVAALDEHIIITSYTQLLI
jgi:hypothetical protein